MAPVVAVVWIAVQALIVGEELRKRAEQLAGIVLIGMVGILLVLKLTSRL